MPLYWRGGSPRNADHQEDTVKKNALTEGKAAKLAKLPALTLRREVLAQLTHVAGGSVLHTHPGLCSERTVCA